MQFDLIEIMKNRLSTLNNQRVAAYASGDVAGVVSIDEELQKTQAIIEKLSS